MGQLLIPGYQESTNEPLSNVLIHYTFNQDEIDSSTVSRGSSKSVLSAVE